MQTIEKVEKEIRISITTFLKKNLKRFPYFFLYLLEFLICQVNHVETIVLKHLKNIFLIKKKIILSFLPGPASYIMHTWW